VTITTQTSSTQSFKYQISKAENTTPDLEAGDLPVVVLITHKAPRAERQMPSSLLANVDS